MNGISLHTRAATALSGVALLAAAAPGAAVAALDIEHDHVDAQAVIDNNNGVLDPGEAFTLVESVFSLGLDPVTAVSGALTADTANVTLTAAQSAWPDLVFGVPTANLTPFAGSIAAGTDCGAKLPFTLNLTTAAGPATVPFAVPTGHAGTQVAYDSSEVPIAIADNVTATSGVDVTTAGRVKHVRVRIVSLTHTYMGDLRLTLVAPDGTSVLLAGNIGAGGQGFQDTVFDASAAAYIFSGTPPYTGSFRPAGDLTQLYGLSQQGTWTLRISDTSTGNRGMLVAWGLDLAPAVCDPPAQPPTGSPPPPGFAHRSPRAHGAWPDPPGFAHANPHAHGPR